MIGTAGLLPRIFAPAAVLTGSYLLLGHILRAPGILLFCVLGTVTLLPMQLAMIMSASKKEFGSYSLRSALAGQERLAAWKILLVALAFFGMAGLLSAFVAPVENRVFAAARNRLLALLPPAFDWTDHGLLKTFPRPVLVLTCAYYFVFNVLVAPVVEELFFRGYLTSHYKRQGPAAPVLIAVLFSLYHFWLPFNNVFRILAFAPVAYAAYIKRNLGISVCFHCLCNLFSAAVFVRAVLG